MKLPFAVREGMIISVDDYLEVDNDQPDARDLAEAVVRCLVAAAEECDVDDADELVSNLEEACELEDSLADTLENSFSKNADLELTGEDIVLHLERELEISWVDEDLLDYLDDIDDIAPTETEEVL